MKRQWFVVAVLVVVVALALAVPSFAAPKPPPAPKGQDYYAGLVTLSSDAAGNGVLSQNGFTGYTVSHGVGVAGLYEVVFPADTFTYGTESVVLLAQPLEPYVDGQQVFPICPPGVVDIDGSVSFSVHWVTWNGTALVPAEPWTWYFHVIASPWAP